MSALFAGFSALADWLSQRGASLGATQSLYASWFGEGGDFVRFNHGRVRQAGSVGRQSVTLRLIEGQRSVVLQQTLSGVAADDVERLDRALAQLRTELVQAHDDPHLLMDRRGGTSQFIESAALPTPAELIGAVASAAALAGDADLVGFYMAGPMARGLISTHGHQHYHESVSWSFDFSLYSPDPRLRDKAVKGSAAGREWQPQALIDAVRQAAVQVPILARPARQLSPGDYRALLWPQACSDLMSMLAWGGFSARALATGQSPLARMKAGQARFDARVHLREALAQARVPRFQDSGFLRPDSLSLVTAGQFDQSLVSPRSAREFQLVANGAGDDESPQAMQMAAGTLSPADAWRALGTGLSISNLWYLNFSDRDACRVTGMTRFACLWVEEGEPVAPVEPLRFDDSLYSLFGDQLEALGSESVWLPDTSSYDWRGFGGTAAPLLLVRQMSFTL